MVTASKKDGKPRSVVDLRALDNYAVRQSHPVRDEYIAKFGQVPTICFEFLGIFFEVFISSIFFEDFHS